MLPLGSAYTATHKRWRAARAGPRLTTARRSPPDPDPAPIPPRYRGQATGGAAHRPWLRGPIRLGCARVSGPRPRNGPSPFHGPWMASISASASSVIQEHRRPLPLSRPPLGSAEPTPGAAPNRRLKEAAHIAPPARHRRSQHTHTRHEPQKAAAAGKRGLGRYKAAAATPEGTTSAAAATDAHGERPSVVLSERPPLAPAKHRASGRQKAGRPVHESPPRQKAPGDCRERLLRQRFLPHPKAGTGHEARAPAAWAPSSASTPQRRHAQREDGMRKSSGHDPGILLLPCRGGRPGE